MIGTPLSLRRRVTLATTLLGLLLSVLCAAATVWVTEDYEHVLASEILRGQAEDYGLRLANGLPAMLPQTQRLSGYLAGSPNLPPAYAALPPGVHEDEDNDGIHIGIFDTAAGRLYFSIDLSDIESIEQHLNLLLAGMVVLGTLIAGWLGWLLSGAALKPVRRLAESVEALPATPMPTQLADGVSQDDLGRLATAIDGYQARLVEADAHEQAFLADASHELRTPLAVIQGVAELLLDDAPAAPAERARIERLGRGVRDMRQLLEAMLGAARRKPLHSEPLEANGLLQEAAALAVAGKPGIRCSIRAAGELHASRQEALLLIGGLGKRLVQPATTGELSLRLEGNRLSLQLAQADVADAHAEPPAAKADRGTGSALLDRLANRLGWRIHFIAPGHVELELDAPG